MEQPKEREVGKKGTSQDVEGVEEKECWYVDCGHSTKGGVESHGAGASKIA